MNGLTTGAHGPTGAFAACAAPAAPLRVLLRSHFEPDLPSASPAPLQRSASATLPANVSLGEPFPAA